MSVYRLCWKAIYCKARLETRLECRQCRLQSIQQSQNNVLKTEMAVGIVIESQPQSLLFQRSFTSTTTGGTRLRSCFHPCFHAWLKYKEIKYPWTCRWHCMKVRGREMPFPFVLSRQGENQSGQDSCFLIKLILQKIPTFTWSKTIWAPKGSWACLPQARFQQQSLFPHSIEEAPSPCELLQLTPCWSPGSDLYLTVSFCC